MTQPPFFDGSIANTTPEATMAVDAAQVHIDERKAAGRAAAAAEQATKRKPFGQTSETNFPYTYWWIVGYNEWVDEHAGQQ